MKPRPAPADPTKRSPRELMGGAAALDKHLGFLERMLESAVAAEEISDLWTQGFRLALTGAIDDARAEAVLLRDLAEIKSRR